MRTTRQAVMLVSRHLLENLMPDWENAARLRFGDMVDGRINSQDPLDVVEPYHKALKLPPNCRITGISTIYAFLQDDIAFRIESPDFIETEEGYEIPKVQAVYQRDYEFTVSPGEPSGEIFAPGALSVAALSGYFLEWAGLAVAVKRTWGQDGREIEAKGIAFRKPIELLWVGVGEPRFTQKVEDITKPLPSKRTAYTPGGVPCRDCGNLLLGQLTERNCCPDCTELIQKQVDVMEALLPYCWRCSSRTMRKLPDGTAECQECSEKKLL